MNSAPSGWAVASLASVTERPLKSDPASTGRTTVRYVDIGLLNGTVDLLQDAPEVIAQSAPSRCRQMIAPGDTLYSTVRPYLRKIALVGHRLRDEYASTGFSVLRPTRDLDPRFLYYFTLSQAFENQILPKQKGVSYPAVLDREVRGCRIWYPAIREQRRIVEILEDNLSHLHAADRSLAENVERLTALESLIADRLAGQAGGEPLRMEDVAELITDGDHNPPKRVPQGVPHVTAKGIRPNGVIDLRSGSFVTEEGFAQTSKRYKPVAGDVLVTCVGTIGRVAVVPEGARFSADRNLAAIRVNQQKVVPDFVAMSLRGTKNQLYMKSASGATAQPHLYLRDLRRLEIPVPPLAEQERLAAIYGEAVAGMRRLATSVMEARTKSERLRSAVLAGAFSGRLTERRMDTELLEEFAR